jgi:23S rRNA (adenine2503-C2)-methyltransferase
LVNFGERADVETVFIPDTNRGTMCVSSQVGCSLACTFCHTGTQKLLRNLTAGEILGQLLIGRTQLQDFSTGRKNEQHTVSNIVLMGQGEPLLNWR